MKRRVLIVEDNPANRELLCDWLEAENFEVCIAENLGQARAVLRKQPIHAVLLDVKLDGEDGLQLADWMRRDPELREIPVIAVTAHALVSDQDRVIRAGCNACISKPIDFKKLAKELELWLAHAARCESKN